MKKLEFETLFNKMNDLNYNNKLNCSSCSKEIDFIWSSSIYNNNEFARLCIDCREDIFNNLYRKQEWLKSLYIHLVIPASAMAIVIIPRLMKTLGNHSLLTLKNTFKRVLFQWLQRRYTFKTILGLLTVWKNSTSSGEQTGIKK